MGESGFNAQFGSMGGARRLLSWVGLSWRARPRLALVRERL